MRNDLRALPGSPELMADRKGPLVALVAYLQGYEVTSEHGDGSEIPRGRRDEDAQAMQPPPCAAAGWRPSFASFARTPARPREQVAEFVGCSPVTVTRIESAQRAPRLADTARMRDAS